MSPPPRRRRTRRFVLLAWAAAFLLLELGLRLVPPAQWEAGLYREDRFDVRIFRKLAALRPHDAPEDSPWGLLGPARFRYNRAGYRGKNWAPEPPPGVRRVAFLGDSRVFGLHVRPDEVLSRAFSRVAGPEVQALNFGVPGASSWAGLDHVVPHALSYGPSAAVLHYDINSSLRAVLPAERWSRRGWSLGNLLRSSAVLRRGEVLLRHAVLGWEGRVPVVPLADYEAHLAGMIETLREGGVEQVVVLVGWTPLEDVPGVFAQERYARYRDASRRTAERLGVQVVEVEEVAAALPPDAERVRGLGIHYAPELLQALAERIHEVLDG